MATALPAADRARGVCCAPRRRLPSAKVAELSEVLKALADPTRLEMVAILRDAKAPVCVCDFTAAFDLSQPTVSHHMAKLREAGLVDAEKAGIWYLYRLRPDLPARVRQLIDALR